MKHSFSTLLFMRPSIGVVSLFFALTFSVHAQKGNSSAAIPPPTTAADRNTGLQKRKDALSRSIVTNVAFRNVGPTIMSGRVVDLDVNPSDPTIFYVAYASGGVWYTNNNGTTFTPVFDSNPTIDIGDIAVDWKNNVIWVGTGECNSSRSSYAGNGIYKSADGGKTWQYKGLPDSHHIGKIIISRDNPNTVWVAAIGHLYSPNKDRGVYKTTDGGETWKQTLFIDDNTGAIDLFQDPDHENTLYAIAWHRERRAWNFVEGGNTSGIYKSSNGGETWNLITGPKSGFPNGDNIGRIGMNIFCGNSDIIYAIVDNQEQKGGIPVNAKLTPADFRTMTRDKFLQLDRKKLEDYLKDNDFPEKYSADYITMQIRSGKLQPVALADYVSDANSDLFNKPIIGAEVYRSDDAGATWHKVNKAPIDNLFFTYGYYFGKIWVSPFDANEVFIAGVELLKSTDGGKTFKSSEGENQHGDHHAMWIDPARKGHLINGNDGGVNISWDDGENWFKADMPPVGQFYSVNVDMDKPYNVYGGLQDNGVWCGPSTYTPSLAWYDDGQYPFKPVLGGDGMQVQVDTRDNNTVYAGFQFGHYFRINKTTGETNEIHPQIDLGDQPLRFNWQAPIWLSQHNQDILYIGANKLFRSMDKGDHFEAISPDLTKGAKTGDVPYGTLTTICESPMKFGLIYTGSDDGLIYVTKDGGMTWTKISDKLPQNMRVNRVIASSSVEGRVYAALSGFQWDNFTPYLFVSDDYGTTWTPIGTDLPMESVNVVREDPVNPDLLFVGTDNGLYCSLDRGKNFMLMSDGLPPVAVHDLMIQPREHDLVVGTHGRSIYIAHIEELENLSDSIRKLDLYVYDPGSLQQKITFEKIGDETKRVSLTPAHLAWYVNKPGVSTIRLKSSDEKYVFAVMRDTSETGLNFMDKKLVVDSAYSANYNLWRSSENFSDQPVTFANGTMTLVPGEYVLEIETAGGMKKTVTIKVKRPKFVPKEDDVPGDN